MGTSLESSLRVARTLVLGALASAFAIPVQAQERPEDALNPMIAASGMPAPGEGTLSAISNEPVQLPLTLSSCHADDHDGAELVSGHGRYPDGSPMHLTLLRGSDPDTWELLFAHDADGERVVARVELGKDLPHPRWNAPHWRVAGSHAFGTETSPFMLLATCDDAS